MKPKRVAGDIVNKLATCEVRSQPYGVTLIIGAWNFPISLILIPLLGAIAAGKVSIALFIRVNVKSRRTTC